MPNAKLNHSYYMVDDSISDRVASLIEPFTVGGRAAKKANPQKGEKAVVFGCRNNRNCRGDYAEISRCRAGNDLRQI